MCVVPIKAISCRIGIFAGIFVGAGLNLLFSFWIPQANLPGVIVVEEEKLQVVHAIKISYNLSGMENKMRLPDYFS